jgi:hypothetical protein
VFIKAGHHIMINPNFNLPFIPRSSKLSLPFATKMLFMKTEETSDYGKPTLPASLNANNE